MARYSSATTSGESSFVAIHVLNAMRKREGQVVRGRIIVAFL
jgi:hypothetical protein